MVFREENQLEKNPSSQAQFNSNARGGWVTLPFTLGIIVGLSLAAGGWYTNLTMFLMQEYNLPQNLAVKINEIVNFGVNFFPIVGAILSDSFFGSFLVINVASFASLLGLVMLGLSSIIPALRPHPCNNTINFSIDGAICETPSIHQYAFLLVARSLSTIGFGCTRFMLSSLGAYQLNKAEHRRVFFNVYILAYEVCYAISYGVIVFIVQEHGKWAIGFGIGIGANTIAVILFLLGSQYYYRHIIPQPNPFVSVTHALASVTLNKIKSILTKDNNRVYDDQEISKMEAIRATSPRENTRSPSKSSVQFDGQSSLTQAQELKKIIKIMPVWSAGIILNAVVTTSTTLVAFQASAMDLTIYRHVKLPAAGSMTVCSLVSTSVTLSIMDRFLYPLWRRITGRPLKPLQRGGIGHVFVLLGMMSLASVEMVRLYLIKTYQFMGREDRHVTNGPIMSAYWLLLPMTLLGIGAAYYFPGGLTFNYQEFPESLKCSSTAMPSLQVVFGFYLSKAFLNVVKHDSSWLPKDVHLGRLDLVYWILALVVAVNFGYYIVCSMLYKYNAQNSSGTDNGIYHPNGH